MADPVLLAQLDALDAQIEVLRVQSAGLRQRILTTEPEQAGRPRVSISLPSRCANYPENKCALRDEDAAMDLQTLGGGPVRQCIGCDVQSNTHGIFDAEEVSQ